jgi:hypothetical protein
MLYLIGLVLLAVGGIMAIIGFFKLLFNAFGDSGLWGLAILAIPVLGVLSVMTGSPWNVVCMIAQLVIPVIYVRLHWNEAKWHFLVWLLGSIIMGAGFGLLIVGVAQTAKEKRVHELVRELYIAKERKEKGGLSPYGWEHIDEDISRLKEKLAAEEISEDQIKEYEEKIRQEGE